MTLIGSILADQHNRFGEHGHRTLRILIFLLFLALIGTVIWLVVREVKRRRTPSLAQTPTGVVTTAAPDAALEQLRMRYARSEIGRDEYLGMVQDLGGTPPA